jgi:transposase-like protein
MEYPRTLMEMEERFSDEEACRQYLADLRWPEGFVCPRCGEGKPWTMQAGRLLCRGCRYQMSVTAGTVFQGTHLPLRTWFRAMWHVTSQKNGMSALGLHRVLGLGSYKTAWAMLHKLRRAMVRPGRDRLTGDVEVDETYWGGEEEGVIGRLTAEKALIIVAAQKDGNGIGRIRMRRIPNLRKRSLHGFIAEAIEPGSTVCTDGLPAYMGLKDYKHDRQVQRRQNKGEHLLPRVHRVVSLLKRWLMGTHQGAIEHKHLDDYLNEFVFRFNRRTSASRGKLFYRLAQHSVQVGPSPFHDIANPQPVVYG